jgi:hypothetical protein
MGRHSGEVRDQGGFAPGWAPEPGTHPGPETPSRPPWTARRKVLTGLGGLTAAIVIAGGASAAAGAFSGGKPVAKPSHQAAAAPAGAASPVGVGSAAVAGASARGASPKPSAHPRVRLGTSLPSLPINAALTGSPAVAWADAALAALGAPATSANVQTMRDWFANEGTPHNPNNPLNLQTPYGGSTVSTADGDPAADRIQAYRSPADFVAAFPIEMNKGSYGAIVAALKAGRGLEGSAATSEIASELSVYSGGGYDSIPAAYNQ